MAFGSFRTRDVVKGCGLASMAALIALFALIGGCGLMMGASL